MPSLSPNYDFEHAAVLSVVPLVDTLTLELLIMIFGIKPPKTERLLILPPDWVVPAVAFGGTNSARVRPLHDMAQVHYTSIAWVVSHPPPPLNLPWRPRRRLQLSQLDSASIRFSYLGILTIFD